MIETLLIAQLTIVASGPPLKPADAAATLRRASPDLDLSRGLYSHRPEDGLVVLWRTRDEDLGRTIHGITYSLPRGWWRTPRARSEETPRRHRSR